MNGHEKCIQFDSAIECICVSDKCEMPECEILYHSTIVLVSLMSSTKQ